MLVVNPDSNIEIPFVYKSGFTYVDPSEKITIYLKRGYGSVGAIIVGPIEFNPALFTGPTTKLNSPDGSVSLEKNSQGSYVLQMKIPKDLFDGIYTIQISTIASNLLDVKEYNMQCLKPIQPNEEAFSPEDKKIAVNKRSKYQPINVNDTNSIILIGHTDAIEPFSIYRVTSIQDAVNKLRADYNSPLLKGLFDAYSSGARDIFIMSAGYMSEYVEEVNLRNIKKFADDGATPNSYTNKYTFYELYYMKLELCYGILRDYEFIDIIVPLETSIVDTGNVNFVSQLAGHCHAVQTITGEVQIGIIGSRSASPIAQNISELAAKNFQILSQVTADGIVEKDAGKYIILIYGEAVFDHKQIQKTYTSSLAAATAGLLASTRVDYGLTKKRVPSALSIYGQPLTSAQIKTLADKKINTISNGLRSRRNPMYDVYITSDYTQSISENYSDASNVRLVAMIIDEVQSMGTNAIGKFSHDRVTRSVDALLAMLKSAGIVQDYTFDAFADKMVRGKLYFNISVVSVRTLRRISFNVATGKGV